MFAKQAAREQIHEATVVDLVAERKRADDNAEELRIEKNKRAQTAANTVTREMKVERDGFLERISELEEDNTLHKDTLKAVQSSHADAMKHLKRDAKEKVAAAELAGKRSDLKAQRAAKAKKKANEEKEEANAEKKKRKEQMQKMKKQIQKGSKQSERYTYTGRIISVKVYGFILPPPDKHSQAKRKKDKGGKARGKQQKRDKASEAVASVVCPSVFVTWREPTPDERVFLVHANYGSKKQDGWIIVEDDAIAPDAKQETASGRIAQRAMGSEALHFKGE